MDATQGYHQIKLAPCASKLTTFLIPSGRYRYKRGPMGLCSTGDSWCARSDKAITDVPNSDKIVDDILVTGRTTNELFKSIRQVLTQARSIGLTLSRRKFQIGFEIAFAGFILSEEGVKPDPKKVEAIKDFPSPKDVTGVRSFLGLANQLGQFLPDLSQATSHIRGLLKKNTAFNWLPEHEVEFNEVKKLLTSDMVVSFFDHKLPTSLLTDASKLHGIGYVLLQHATDGKLRLIQAGSRSLTPAEGNYAPIESECLAAVWAIKKCKHFLAGCPEFTLITDHQPLLGIFKKDLGDIENRRLQRLRESVLDYSFKVEWVEGKSHLIADALSRNPVNGPNTELASINSVLHSLDPSLDGLRSGAKECPSYQRLVECVKSLSPSAAKSLPPSDAASAYKSVWDDLSMHSDGQLVLFQTDRIVVPASNRASILKLLHRGHSGIVKTKTLARQLYYWPGMTNDIKNLVSACDVCVAHLPKQQAMPLKQTEASFPLEHTSADLFSLGGKNYLVYVDRFSGMIWCDKLNQVTTASVTKTLDFWMMDFGYPNHIRTDGGPQFRGPFKEWCLQRNIVHEVSSPYHPQSNGHAEAAVKAAKALLDKVGADFKVFREHLFAWRNTPRPDGVAPADLFFGRRQRSALPGLRALSLSLPLQETAAKRSAGRRDVKDKFDSHASPLPPLQAGEEVVLRDPARRAWIGEGTIIQPRRDDQLSYEVQLPGEASTIRNRTWIKKKNVEFSDV